MNPVLFFSLNLMLFTAICVISFRPALVGLNRPKTTERRLSILFSVGVSFVLLIMSALPMLAQEVGGVAEPGIDWAALFLPFISSVLSLFLLYVSAWIKVRFNVDIQAQYRDGLHSALMTGARLAFSKQLTGDAAIALILDYVQRSVPDALMELKPNKTILTQLAESKLQEVASGLTKDALDRAIDAAVSGGFKR